MDTIDAGSYARHPHLHDDLIAFVAVDDVWLAPIAGGRAWRLTSDRVAARSPRFSPDGSKIAYVSHRDGHPEVMIVPFDGGSARRLTWWGASTTRLLGWRDDEHVLVASHAGEAILRHQTVRAVALDGSVERLDLGPASGVAAGPDGAVVLSSPGARPPADWKRYRGGTAVRLWWDENGSGEWVRLLPDEPASLVDPMWIDGRLVFVSDRAASFPDRADEQANLWVWDEPGRGRPRQLTHQDAERGYVRDATTDGRRIVWHSRGRIWMMADLDGPPTQIAVSLPGAAPVSFTAEPTRHLATLIPDRTGNASLALLRGSAWWLPHRAGPARAIAARSGVRVRAGAVLGTTGRVVLASDRAGEDALDVHDVAMHDSLLTLGVGEWGRVLTLAADPAGRCVATISHDGAIRLTTVPDRDEGGGDVVIREIGRSRQGEAASIRFSPDGRYVVWSEPTRAEAELHRLMVWDTASDEAIEVTSGTYHDHQPAFTADGQHLVFFSDRTFDPSYDNHEFALSFRGSTRPWLLPLSATAPAPFGPSADGWPLPDPDDGRRRGGDRDDHHDRPVDRLDERTGSGGSERVATSPDFDADGAEQRIVPFPVPSGDYRSLRVAEAGVLWIRESAAAGEVGARRAGVTDPDDPDTVEYWSFDGRRLTTIVDHASEIAVSGDGRRIVVHHEGTVTVRPADRPAKEDDHEIVAVDLTRMRYEVDPRAEWRQMFDDNARIMRDHYWRADMNGVDWGAVVDRWRPVVDRIASHDDLVDVLWETVGELNTSHAYVAPERPPGDADRRLGFLGADLSPTDDGWRIDRVLPGESSDPNARSPLMAAGVDARPGDVVVAIDGQALDHAIGPAGRLIGAAGKPVQITLRRDGSDRRVAVVPIADEEVLRYQDWVRGRRDHVQRRGGGRLGYVHIPDMMSAGWAQFHRAWRHATAADGLVVDVRYNRGGHTSELVLARLARRIVGWGLGRHYADAVGYPTGAPLGPVVLVTNEFAGSDGDIVNAASQALGIAPVVGVRTWGGVVGIDGRFDLVDGTVVTQPRYSFWLEGKGWGVENHGVDPDIEVEHTPADFFGDDDPQLDRAIAELLDRLDVSPAARPPEIPDPIVRRRT